MTGRWGEEQLPVLWMGTWLSPQVLCPAMEALWEGGGPYILSINNHLPPIHSKGTQVMRPESSGYPSLLGPRTPGMASSLPSSSAYCLTTDTQKRGLVSRFAQGTALHGFGLHLGPFSGLWAFPSTLLHTSSPSQS